MFIFSPEKFNPRRREPQYNFSKGDASLSTGYGKNPPVRTYIFCSLTKFGVVFGNLG